MAFKHWSVRHKYAILTPLTKISVKNMPKWREQVRSKAEGFGQRQFPVNC